jgi:hypothetical protein
MITYEDLFFVRSVLPYHYKCQVLEPQSCIICKSAIGIQLEPGFEDEQQWKHVFAAFQQHFGSRFMEVNHATCAYHCNFSIYIKK